MSERVALRTVNTHDEWRTLCARFDDHNYRQLWPYALAAAERSGANSEFVAVERAGETVGLASVRLRRVPVIGGGLAHISGGPLVRRVGVDPDPDDLAAVVEALSDEYVERRGMALRMLCPLGDAEWNRAAAGTLARLGLTAARWPRPYRTMVIDTTRDIEGIRAGFSKNWRKKLKRGETRGLDLRVSSETEALDHAVRMHEALIDRKGFSTEVDATLFRDIQADLAPVERLLTILVEHEGEPVGMNVVSALGDTLAGIIGATTETGAKLFGAHLMEWAAIEAAHERGMRFYDMGGFDPDGNPGVADFKNGTRGEVLVAAGPFERRAAGLRPGLARAGERLYRAMRKAPISKAG